MKGELSGTVVILLLLAGLVVGFFAGYTAQSSGAGGELLSGGGGQQDLSLDVTSGETNATVSIETELEGTLHLVYWERGEAKQSFSAELFAERDNHVFLLKNLTSGAEYRVEGVLVDKEGTVHRSGVVEFTASAGAEDTSDTSAPVEENDTGTTGGGIAGGGGGESEDGSGSGSSGTGDTTDTVQYFKNFSFNESKSVIDIGLQTAAYTTSGYMRFKVFVEGEEFGPFEVPDDDQLYKRSMATIGQNFTVGVIERSGPDVEVQEFQVFESG